MLFSWQCYSCGGLSYILICSAVVLAADSEKQNKPSGAPRSDRQEGLLSLSDILYRSEANSDASQDGPRSERDDSDYYDELEVDFETSVSDDEDHESESNMVHRNLNFRMDHKDEPARGTNHSNRSSPSPRSSQSEKKSYQVIYLILNCSVSFEDGCASQIGLLRK